MVPISDDDLFPQVQNPQDTYIINPRCLVRTQDGYRVVVVSGVNLAQYAIGDHMSEAHVMVNLVAQCWANQTEVARAFGCAERTLRRHQQRFEDGGLAALGRADGYPQGRPQLATSRSRWIQQLKLEGHSQREIARRLGVNEKAVRKVLRRLGWKSAASTQTELPLVSASAKEPDRPNTTAVDGSKPIGAEVKRADPNLSAVSCAEPPCSSLDHDPTDRHEDRLLARLGLLDDAPPLFGSRAAVARAGVLLALPALIGSGVFDCAQKIYGSLGPAFFGLRTTVLILLLMALWRIKRPEALKEHSPAELGRVLGVDRAPEVKTLRRKLTRIASFQRATQFGQTLAQHRIVRRGETLGFLYVDGHVRVYHGQRRLPKAHVARMRLSMPATTDYWVNDTAGDPLFVITAEDARAAAVGLGTGSRNLRNGATTPPG